MQSIFCLMTTSRSTYHITCTQVNLQAPCVLYTGQAFHYSQENAFYIFNQQIYFIVRYFLDRASLI